MSENQKPQNSGSGWNQAQRPASGDPQALDAARERAQTRQAGSAKTEQPVTRDRAQPSAVQQGRPGSNAQMPSQDTLRALDRQRAARSTGQMRTQGYRAGAYRGGGGVRRR